MHCSALLRAVTAPISSNKKSPPASFHAQSPPLLCTGKDPRVPGLHLPQPSGLFSTQNKLLYLLLGTKSLNSRTWEESLERTM